eukprot:TRINITY_DN72778_c0_g1_i1.p1 TRINITY_DN72778_c0_g1~~TRINITY_DN72778_c0_g1_i1.p1  ORF type:complete len:132 (-),score=6.55 TRINITY_DN72778_c0_g1_i1:6-401(-)
MTFVLTVQKCGYLQVNQYRIRHRQNCSIVKRPVISERPLVAEPDSSQQQNFQWKKQWYPAQVLEHLDPTKPIPFQLFGKDLVIWRDGENTWRCFEDKCPHRLVPLSEGRLETDGTLQCAYHGWRFNGKGEC